MFGHTIETAFMFIFMVATKFEITIYREVIHDDDINQCVVVVVTFFLRNFFLFYQITSLCKLYMIFLSTIIHAEARSF